MPAAKKSAVADPDVFLVELRITNTDNGKPAKDTDSLLEILEEDLEALSITCMQPVRRGEDEDAEFSVSVISIVPTWPAEPNGA